MSQRNFLPGPRAFNLIILAGGFALGWAIYMRYALVEQSQVGLACLGVETSTCVARRAVIGLFDYSAFGITALVLSAIQLIRPSRIMFTLALMATAAGLVLYNNNLSGVAAGLLLISFARPWQGARD